MAVVPAGSVSSTIYECPFYYIDYCLSTMAALQFFLLSLKDHKDAWQRYLKLVLPGRFWPATPSCARLPA